MLWQTLRLLAAPGALVHIHDLRRPQHPAALDVLIQSYASGCDPLLRRDYAASLRAAFRIEEVQTQLAQAGLGGLRVEAREDRYLEVRGRLS